MASILDPKASANPSTVPQPKVGALEAKTKVPISIESFLLGFKIPFDVYSKDSTGFSSVLKKWTKFDQDTKNALKSKGITYLYVEGEPLQVKEYFTEKAAAKPATDSRPDMVTQSYASYSKDKGDYHHVSRLVFTVGARVNFSIFTVDNMRFIPVIAVTSNQSAPITEAVRNAKGDLSIKVSDMKLYREYIFGLSKGNTTAPDNKTALQAKVASIKENVKMNVRDFLSDPGNAKNTDGVINSANQIINVLKRKEAGLSDMLTLRARDFHIYNHSSNVAVLSTAMAVAMGMDQGKIEKLAIGAIMHDVGKGSLPPEILYKKDRLTPEEFSSWKKHVNEGITILRDKGISRESFSALQQHHERLSGGGYPFGLKGVAITPFGKIMSIVDCYDALITPRPLRPILTPFTALNMIMKETTEKGDFDLELVKLFINILKGQGRI